MKNYSRATKDKADITQPGSPSGAAPRSPGEGEGFGAGNTNRAIINQRPNKSLNRNDGVERPSANTGRVPTVGAGVRKTGRI